MRRTYRLFRSTILLGVLGACATLDSQKPRGAYESFVWSNLRESTVSSAGRSLVNVRWMVLDSAYFEQRSQMLGFDDALAQSAKTQGKTYLLLAVQMKASASFAKADLDVRWGNRKAELLQEVVNVAELRSLYAFAYPFHRVFLYETQPSEVSQLTVLTPWGKLEDRKESP